ncbi:hypothetical protein OIU74_019070 [Salix koriyanagi]|uniref:Uncharacterized protein n=1 Tax=Salix koriyanagi TaxID=2511006 RepID=A0A9Q1AIR9_9ROSI|nr:hypothetical protein OIU74_019070 [Salix koriyanagi]
MGLVQFWILKKNFSRVLREN